MERWIIPPLGENHRRRVPQLLKDFRSAVNYVSFYSVDSPFVTQCLRKLHQEIAAFTADGTLLALHPMQGLVAVNGILFEGTDALQKTFERRHVEVLLWTPGAHYPEVSRVVKLLASPSERDVDFAGALSEKEDFPNVHALPLSQVFFAPAEPEEPSFPRPEIAAPRPGPGPERTEGLRGFEPAAPAADPVVERLKHQPHPLQAVSPDAVTGLPPVAVFSLLAECWQYALLLKRYEGAAPEIALLERSFQKLFRRLLDRLDTLSPEFARIADWFRTPEGDPVPEGAEDAMRRLLETAVESGWTGVLTDPSTEGLVGDCLARWGSTGRQDLVARSVTSLAHSLGGGPVERRIALTHLRDPRPFAREENLLETVLSGLVRLLAAEADAGTYQAALLLAWDLTEPSLEAGRTAPVLDLLATLQEHAEGDGAAFPERARLAHRFLIAKGKPDLLRRLVEAAAETGRLSRYPLLAGAAAPVLFEDYRKSGPEARPAYLRLFGEMSEAVQAEVLRRLPDVETEADLRALLPVLRAAGVDGATALLLAPWMARGSRELKLNLMGMLEQAGSPAGGPALRPALLDDSDEIAIEAARLMGRLGYRPGVPLLLRAAELRRRHGRESAPFLEAVCEALGKLGASQAVPFLMETAGRSGFLGRRTLPLPVRLAAARALISFNDPQVWTFLEELSKDKDPELQEAIAEMIRERASGG